MPSPVVRPVCASPRAYASSIELNTLSWTSPEHTTHNKVKSETPAQIHMQHAYCTAVAQHAMLWTPADTCALCVSHRTLTCHCCMAQLFLFLWGRSHTNLWSAFHTLHTTSAATRQCRHCTADDEQFWFCTRTQLCGNETTHMASKQPIPCQHTAPKPSCSCQVHTHSKHTSSLSTLTTLTTPCAYHDLEKFVFLSLTWELSSIPSVGTKHCLAYSRLRPCCCW